MEFVRSFCESELPPVVKEAALYNLSTLRSQTCFRTEDGRFYGWEGCNDQRGCCLGSCTHVWNYEQATAFLFGALSKSMREIEFLHMTKDNGHMSFRVFLPLEHAREHGIAAADGQMGCLLKVYRDWQLSGDDAFLGALWPRVRQALEFCWIPGGWDADRDGVPDAQDQCANTPAGTAVGSTGCPLPPADADRLLPLTDVVAAGNTVISHFLYGISPSPIRRPPYHPVRKEYPIVPGETLGTGPATAREVAPPDGFFPAQPGPRAAGGHAQAREGTPG